MTYDDRVARKIRLDELLVNLILALILFNCSPLLFLIRHHEIIVATVLLDLVRLRSKLLEVSLPKEVIADFEMIYWGPIIIDVDEIDILAGRSRIFDLLFL